MQSFAEELQLELKADTEQIQNYIQKEIHPILSNSKIEGECQLLINSYFENLDPKTGLFYQARKNLTRQCLSLIKNGYRFRQGTSRHKIYFRITSNDLKQMESSITSILEPLFPLQSPLT
jgi:hypothetical protein